MDTVTYPDPRTVSFMSESVVAVEVNVKLDRDLAMEFGVRYTPTILILDEKGNERHRTVGFQPVEEFIPSLLIGIGKVNVHNGLRERAIDDFQRLLDGYPMSKSAAEAAELLQASAKRSNGSRHPL